MGLGHLVRSAALAEMLHLEFSCRLVYRYCPPALLADWQKIYTETLAVTEQGEEEEARWLATYGKECTTSNNIAIIVLDGYHFDTAYQKVIVAAGLRLVCIDDIHDCRHVAHLLINHAPGAHIAQYESAQHTHFALGLRFALLRAPFRDVAQHRYPSPAKGIFLCLGGADPDNAVLYVLQEFERYGVSTTVDLVLGSAYLHEGTLTTYLAKSSLQVRLHRSLSDEQMAVLMKGSSIGVTSPSTVSLEYLSAGGRLYLYQIADNQSGIKRALIQQGYAQDFSEFQLVAPPKRPNRPALDGKQDVRLRKLFRGLDLAIRLATVDDTALYYQWANDPLVRAQSFSTEPILLDQHQQWFTTKLVDPNSLLLVFTRPKDGVVGQVRFSIRAVTATIGYSVAATARGQGLGLPMLHYAVGYLQRHWPAPRTIVGYVKRTNQPSLKTFRQLGYQESETDQYPNTVKFTLNEL